MPEQRVIVFAARNQGLTVTDAALHYGVSRRLVRELLQRETEGGIARVETRTQRPQSNRHRDPELPR
ncbi:helix-turn-helix domain-containing protein [Arthrobacter sp. SLBN-122]|uniref:helix-turn-helix domain-containing protein n=1 Tax=Arthrobacter sp. SLBN-122 TaxID=2768455 RepID=UPI001F3CE95C